MNSKLRMIIAEDEPAILRGLIAAISQISGHYEITATATNGQEAFEKILTLKPDVVITDIQMPLMSGLDLIEAVLPECPQTFFIILTGHADFEYARRAMKLNVTDYLLKPIDPDELEALLKRLELTHLTNHKNEQLKYIGQHLYSENHHVDMPNLLDKFTLHLMFVFFGSVSTNLYNEMSIGSQIANDSDYESLIVLSRRYGIELSILRGNYFNERVFVFIFASDDTGLDDLDIVTKQIYCRILSKDIFTNCILSDTIENGAHLSEEIRSCYLFAASHALFGQNILCRRPPSVPDNSTICVTPEIEAQLNCLKPAMDFEAMENLCHNFIRIWSCRPTSQFQLQTDIRCIFHAMTQKTGQLRRVYPNPSELLCASSSYEDLFENILLEFKKIHEAQNTISPVPKATLQLAHKVKNYLDNNYTHPITYKDFNDIFGYNEKYISLIFKEEFDLSPSKYVTELRLSAAKNLMRQNPDILLKDIAAAVGYEDQLYFSRVFKNSVGMSPKAFQRTGRPN